ncbi:hypothetical protein [Mucilaginibacter glaciei]|uniref:Uncharacterized protein n=1 Tax=Mucilaginibacter glaciei TaxID=2772109 RepID=A0A926NTW7_9SPHI|nr:hypothetical protein [Mucilaginibacter glaciei]MBD1393915.1 hypothetical protein [Mucilaginibacter glaciei]
MSISLLFFVASLSELHLKDYLRWDKGRLNQHGVYLSDTDKDKLKIFDRYAHIDLSGFKFSKRIVGRHIVKSWTNEKKKIHEVISVLPALPTYEVNDIKSGKVSTEANPHKRIFTFHTYVINFPNQQLLVYQTQINEGMVYYSIGKKRYNPLKEDILLGVNYPDEKGILDLIKL